MTDVKKYPILERHRNAPSLGRFRDVSSADGVVSATVDLNRRGKRFVLKMRHGNERYMQPTRLQRENAQHERLVFWASLVTLVVLVMGVAGLAGMRHGYQTANTLMEKGRHGQ